MPVLGERASTAVVAPTTAASRTATTFLISAIAYGAAAHGAFYARELLVVVVLLALALVAAFVVAGPSRAAINAATVAASGLAVWYLVAGAAGGHMGGALPAFALLFALVAVVLVVRRADARERAVLLSALFVIGAFVALSGWAGVAWRQSPRALNGEGLWRAATTITYPNVAGALLAAVALLALAQLDRARRRPAMSLTVYVMATGALATASRGAVIGLAVGLVVLAWVRRGELMAGLPALAGAMVSASALLPSMPAAHPAHPAVAVVGLAAGAGIALLPIRAMLIGVALVAVVVVLVPGPRDAVTGWWRPVRDGRFTAASSDRTHELHAGLQLVHDHPIAGVGPGNVDLHWNVTYLVRLGFHDHYVHDEYVQTMVEAGIVGFAVALAGFAAVARAVYRARRVANPNVWSGSVAALVALAVQSATDFLWHVSIVPIVAALIVALATAHDGEQDEGARSAA